MLKTLIGTTDPQNYAQYLNEKIENVVNLFKKNNLDFPKYEVFESPAEYYRMKQNFLFTLMKIIAILLSACLNLKPNLERELS